MSRQDPINSDPGASRLRMALEAVAEVLRRAFWAFEDRVLWNGRDALRGAFDRDGAQRALEVVRRPFERLAWPVEERLLWPLGDRVAGWSAPARAAGGGALAAVAVGAVALGAVLASSGGEERAAPRTLAATELSATGTEAPKRKPAPAEPALQGAPPVLSLDGAVATARDPDAEAAAATDAPDAEAEEGSGAAASSAKVVPAGPAAMKVARRFAEAFVVYEVGEERARARAAFDETATPELADALAKRPPRLPERVKVPRARVVNLVPGPRRGRAYSVSVSLLRVGVTSELRLELRKNTDGWLVTDVRG